MIATVVVSAKSPTSNPSTTASDRGPAKKFTGLIAASFHENAHLCAAIAAIHELIQLDLSIHERCPRHRIVIKAVHLILELGCALIVRREARPERFLIVSCNLGLVTHDLGLEQGVQGVLLADL